MGFRTLEIGQAAEIHIKEGQLEVTTKEGTVYIPVEDLSIIMMHGANIRLSSMDLSILSRNKIGILTLDESYMPAAMVLPFEGHARQSKLMHMQANTSQETYVELWKQIIRQKEFARWQKASQAKMLIRWRHMLHGNILSIITKV